MLHSPGLPHTCDPDASNFQILGLQVCTGTPSQGQNVRVNTSFDSVESNPLGPKAQNHLLLRGLAKVNKLNRRSQGFWLGLDLQAKTESLEVGAGCEQAGFSPWSRDRCGLYQNLDVSWTNLTLLWLSCVGGSRTERGEFRSQNYPVPNSPL